MLSYDEMELMGGDRKTALFLIMSDTDTTRPCDCHAAVPAFQSACDKADDKYGGRLPVPCEGYLR